MPGKKSGKGPVEGLGWKPIESRRFGISDDWSLSNIFLLAVRTNKLGTYIVEASSSFMFYPMENNFLLVPPSKGFIRNRDGGLENGVR